MMKEMIEVKSGAYIKDGESYDFNFYTDLTSSDKLFFVNAVTDILIDEDNYNFIIRDLIFDYFVIDTFTDVNTLELEESEDFINDLEEFLEETNIVDVVKVNMVDGLLDELNHAVNLNLEYRTGIHVNPISEALTGFINTLERKVVDVDLSGMAEIAAKFNGMKDELTMDNLVKAYTSTNIFKNNLKEVEEAKK